MVAATVTLSNISVTIPSGYPTSVDYGVLQLNSQAIPQTYIPAVILTYAYKTWGCAGRPGDQGG